VRDNSDESVGIVLAYIDCTEIRERHMELVLTDDEAETLSGILSDALPGLKFETARTREKDLLHVLIKREQLSERLIERLRLSSSSRQ
jgi:hypothetical protein